MSLQSWKIIRFLTLGFCASCCQLSTHFNFSQEGDNWYLLQQFILFLRKNDTKVYAKKSGK